MRLVDFELDGYGKLANRRFTFAPGFNVVCGPNEAGKSTLADAIVAMLYGPARKEREARRPWSGAPYRGTLRYVLADGREFELQRDFSRDGRGVRVFDRNGNDVTAELSSGRNVNPGDVHLHMPREVFLNASCVRQQLIAVDGGFADRISASLARALDGGPREDAARRALESLDLALREHVGTERATKNAPLRTTIARAEAAQTRADEARGTLRALMETRERLSGAQEECERLGRLIAEHERRGRAMRAASLRSRLDSLRKLREEIGALDAARAELDDVAEFPEEQLGELERRYLAWHDAETRAKLTAEETRRASDAISREEIPALAGIDDATIETAEALAREAEEARAEALGATNAAASARRTPADDGLLGVGFVLMALALLAAVGFAIAHWWTDTGAAGGAALVFMLLWAVRMGGRRRRHGALARLQERADDATAREARADAALAAILTPFAVSSVGELRVRTERVRARAAQVALAHEAAERAKEAAAQSRSAGAAFDKLASALVEQSGSRERDLERARALAARRRERDGIENNLRMKDVLRDELLRDDDELALQNELAELLASGVEEISVQISQRAFEAEGAEIEQQLRDAQNLSARCEAEIAAVERTLPDIAALDDETETYRAEAARLSAFERAVKLARATIEERTRESHEKFARRLEDYAATQIAAITGQRYTELRVDPTSLTIRVRAPETREIVDLDALSAGTRDQVYLVVRLAMARMFAEGLEVLPLLLDDPFAFWDEERLERCLPILMEGAKQTQTIVFTSSDELAGAAASLNGTHRIVLDAPVFA